MSSNNKVHFPGLNGLRFFAALMVIIAHIEGFKYLAGLPSINAIDFWGGILSKLGVHGVKIFFVLSGFLITYLLLVERERTDTINIKKFYIRRILRIWPLYFLIIILGFFVFPNTLSPDYFVGKVNPNFTEKLLLMVFFLPNLVYYLYGHIFSVGVLWSIGAEEQFYLMWPLLVKKTSKEKTLKVLLLCIGSLVFIKFSLLVAAKLMGISDSANPIIVLFNLLPFESMLIGAVFAGLVYKKSNLLKFIYAKYTQVGLILAAIAVICFNPSFNFLTDSVYSLIFVGIIVNVAANNTQSFIKLNRPFWDYVGKLSYAMYMFHSIAVVICIYILQAGYFGSNLIFSNILLYLSSIGITILMSIISYHFFEKPILRYQASFKVIKSG